MKKTAFKIFAIFTITGILVGCSQTKPNVDIKTYQKVNPIFDIKYVDVKVIATRRSVIVKNIIVNKGNCKIEDNNIFTGGHILPKKLKFGESVSVPFTGPCDAIQVDVVTNNGTWVENY